MVSFNQWFLVITISFLLLKSTVIASTGDRSHIFGQCLNQCWTINCTVTRNQKYSKHDLSQPVHLLILGWSCLDECKYNCMWQTVDEFIQVYNYDVPQFYGKWPFKRILGIQEPASTLASILNLAANIYMIKKLKKQLEITKRAPFKPLWYSSATVCVNTWIWSTIFHTRDVWFTEIMDYFSAFGLVLFQLNTFFIRLWGRSSIRHEKLIMLSVNMISLIYYTYHCYFLSIVKFDYGYNMTVNIIAGILNSICWIIWSLRCYFKRGMKYMWRCAFSFVLFDVLMILEIFDFSPIFWTLDSHALWHFTTVAIPFYWYQFIIDDIRYFQYEEFDKLH